MSKRVKLALVTLSVVSGVSMGAIAAQDGYPLPLAVALAAVGCAIPAVFTWLLDRMFGGSAS